MKSLGLFTILFTVACSHTVHLRNYSDDNTPIANLKDKKVAVVIDSNLKESYSTTSDVHTYNFSEVVTGLQDAFKRRLQSNVKQLSITQGSTPEGYDLYMYPDFKVRSVNDFWDMACLVNYTMVIKNSRQELLATESGQKKHHFGGDDEKTCQATIGEVFDDVNNKALLAATKR